MANYLERVASSAGRKAAVAKPPSSGPPLLPAGRDFLPPTQELFSGNDEDLFGESSVDEPNKLEPSRLGESTAATETARPRAESPLRVEPPAAPTPTPVSLRNESPFIVHLPKTLQPVITEKHPLRVSDEPPDRVALTDSSGMTKRSMADEASVEVLQSSDTEIKETKTRYTVADERSTRPMAPKSLDRRSDNEPVVKKIDMEAMVPEPQPVELRDREVTPTRIPTPTRTHGDEHLPIAVPRQPPAVVVGGGSRPEPSRISIGQFEVLVNNHPVLETVRPPAAPPMQSNSINLEKRYLDRFRLRR